MKTSIGIYWTFEPTPFHLPDWACRGPLTTLLFVLVGSPLLIWHKLGLGLRRQMACSRVKTIRRLADCKVLMVGYCLRPGGSTVFQGVMTFDRLLELSPEAARQEIRRVLLSLQGDVPLDTGESIDELLRSVYTFVETRRSPKLWTTQPVG